MDLLVFVVSLAAAVFSGGGLILMYQQLVTARAGSAARGLSLSVAPSGIVTMNDNGSEEPRAVRFRVSASGTAVWADMQGFTVDTRTGESDSLWSAVAAFTGTHDEVTAIRHMPTEDMYDTEFVVTWTEPWQLGARTAAVKVALLARPGPDRQPQTTGPAQTQAYEWKWKFGHRLRHQAQEEKRWWLPRSGTPRPLGVWQPVTDSEFVPAQLPGWPW